MTTGERIKNNRIKQGMTQKALGEACGIAESTIRRYELGKLNPKIETIKKIAAALGVSVSDIAGWSYFDEQYPNVAAEVNLLERIEEQFGSGAAELLSQFAQLNDSGKAKAIDALSDLTMIDKYTQKE